MNLFKTVFYTRPFALSLQTLKVPWIYHFPVQTFVFLPMNIFFNNLRQDYCPGHKRSGLFWLATNSACPVRIKKLHVDYKAAPLPHGPYGGYVSMVLLTSDFSHLVLKEGWEEKDRGLSCIVGLNSFQTGFWAGEV